MKNDEKIWKGRSGTKKSKHSNHSKKWTYRFGTSGNEEPLANGLAIENGLWPCKLIGLKIQSSARSYVAGRRCLQFFLPTPAWSWTLHRGRGIRCHDHVHTTFAMKPLVLQSSIDFHAMTIRLQGTDLPGSLFEVHDLIWPSAMSNKNWNVWPFQVGSFKRLIGCGGVVWGCNSLMRGDGLPRYRN